MSYRVLKKGLGKGRWTMSSFGTVYVTCPLCGKITSLEDHRIEYRGHVSPMVLCARKGCEFSNYVWLEDWKDPPRPEA